MPSANENLLDAELRHAIGLRRYSAGLVKRIQNLLAEMDADLVLKLRGRLPKFEGRDVDFTSDRWKALLDDVRAARAASMSAYRDMTRPELVGLSVEEAKREMSLLQSAIPFEIAMASVPTDQLRAVVSSRPFQGKLLADWYKELEVADRSRLTAALQLGIAQGQTTDEIVRTVVGTRAANYTDGILSITRRDASSIVRTAITHVSNTAREYVWEANKDIILAEIWHSTLDGRTTAGCRSRDGKGSPVGDRSLPAGVSPLTPPSIRPPAHIGCRSVMVAMLDPEGLVGNRPYVTDTRGREEREVDFRAMAKEQGKDIKDVRRAWAVENIGRTPASTTYNDFLKRQTAEFQDAVLGRTKGRLFRTGQLSVDQYTDRAGNELTLAQLAKTKPEVFRAANLDPSQYAA